MSSTNETLGFGPDSAKIQDAVEEDAGAKARKRVIEEARLRGIQNQSSLSDVYGYNQDTDAYIKAQELDAEEAEYRKKFLKETRDAEAQRQFSGSLPQAEWNGDLSNPAGGSVKVNRITSYTGTDVKVYILLPSLPGVSLSNSKVLQLGTIRAISISSFREKQPVRALGHVYAKGFTRGTRTVAGTMIFSVLLNDVFDQIRNVYLDKMKSSSAAPTEFPFAMSDQLPPFDLFLKFNNESGYASHMVLYAVELFTDGMSISVDNLIIEQQIRYQARGYSGLEWDGREVVEILPDGQPTNILNQESAYNFFSKVMGTTNTIDTESGTLGIDGADPNTDNEVGYYANVFEKIKAERNPFS